MSKKSVWQKSIWRAIIGLSAILTIIASILQISGTINVWNLFVFFSTSIPLYYAILFVIALIIISYSAIKFRKRHKNILDFHDARKIALLCQEPRTTDFLRQQYDYWQSQSTWVFIGGYGFDDYMKRLEKEGYLNYVNGKWQVTTKALEYISKYHGDSLS